MEHVNFSLVCLAIIFSIASSASFYLKKEGFRDRVYALICH